ncbi:MAG: cobamide remodeling phosphodiesterase CbiR [Deltaproteobacteria bacterium]|nr:cobamide remodeling phosphodiesterase CbiR [Deltaproteobacteria bacterium]
MFSVVERDKGNYLALFKSYRGIFPFRLATTSFIYPDRILPNAMRLAPYLDEMELILFESKNLPDREEISDLSALQDKQGLSYNVHLPLDIFLGHPSDKTREEGIAAVQEVVTLTKRLTPSTYTLHYVCDNDFCERNLSLWQRHIAESTGNILKMGITPGLISVETLNYPLTWVEDIINDFSLSICLDLGHILLLEEDPLYYLDTYLEKTAIIHLHGVCQGRDHLGLDVLDDVSLAGWLRLLKEYTGTVSIEVFSFQRLQASLEVLEKLWEKV